MDYIKNFELTLTVTQEDLDEINHVNNVRYIQWIQDIAKAHWKQIASEEVYSTYFWIVLRHCVDYKGSAHLNDEIRISTKFINSKGATAKSIIEMHIKDTNKLLLQAETTWCLFDVKTKRPTRVTEEISNILN